MSSSSLWQRFPQHSLYYRDLGFSLDISRMKFPDDFFEKMQPQLPDVRLDRWTHIGDERGWTVADGVGGV
jgi:hypothetical protein